LPHHRRTLRAHEADKARDILAVRLLADRLVARRGALADAREQTGTEESVLWIPLDDVQRACAVLEHALERFDGTAQRSGRSERPKNRRVVIARILRAVVIRARRIARDEHAWIILPH